MLQIKNEWLKCEIERKKERENGEEVERDKIRSEDAENSRELMGKVKNI